jgi:flagellar biosynthesis/type III secretory pathway protein FliH
MKYVSYAEEKGIEKGMEQGRAQGGAQGELLGQIRLCQELLKQKPTPEEELLALPQEELRAVLARLRNQLLPNGDG